MTQCRPWRLARVGVAVVAGAFLSPGPSARAQGSVPFQGASGGLAPGWRWVRHEPAATRLEAGEVLIRLLPGGMHADHDGVHNLLVRPFEPRDAIVSVRVSHAPEGLYENAQIVLFRDVDNYVVVTKESYPGRDPDRVVQIVAEVDGEPDVAHKAVYGEADAVLGLRLSGRTVTGLYRRGEDDPWREIGAVALPDWDRYEVGIGTSYGVEGVERWARFRDFRVAPAEADGTSR